MATGDITWFDQGMVSIGGGAINLATDSIRLGLVDDSVTPAAATADPRWGSGGGTDLSAAAVSTGTSYTGPIALSGTTWALSGGKAIFDANDVSIAQDAGGFTDARWGVFYSDTAAGKQAFAFIDLGQNRSVQSGPLSINWNAGGIVDIDQA